jgi:hypothetical protein
MKKVLYPILAVIVFMVMQVFAGIAMIIFAIVKNPTLIDSIKHGTNPETLINEIMAGDSLGWALILSGILTVLIIAALKMIDWKTVFNVKIIDWKISMIGIIGALIGIFYTDVVSEFFDLPNDMEDVFLNMSNTLMGALAIGVIGPVVEELIFREAILGYMLKSDVNKWVAIIASALVFGIIHANLAQIPFAIVIGIIFGIIYYKTGNIVITSILHIVNNSFAVWTMYSMGEDAKDVSLTEWLGGTGIAVGILIPLSVVCFWMLRYFWLSYKSPYYIMTKFRHNAIPQNLNNSQDNETVL